jgi:hypothetical protein
MGTKLSNIRDFSYDIKSMLGEDWSPAPVVVEHVSITISGMPGSFGKGDWLGYGNGTHELRATQEILNPYLHVWWRGYEGGTLGRLPEFEYLICWHNNRGTYYDLAQAAGSTSQAWPLYLGGLEGGAKFKYYFDTGSPGNYYHYEIRNYKNSPSASIGSYNTGFAQINSVDFSWTQGVDWDRGNMGRVWP